VIDAFLAHRVWPRVASVFGKGESFDPLFFFVPSLMNSQQPFLDCPGTLLLYSSKTN